MNSKLLLKLLLFLLGIELIIVGMAYFNLALLFIGIVNVFVILFMFFEVRYEYIEKVLYYLKLYFIKIKSIKFKFSGEKEDLSLKNITDNEFYKAIKYFFIHYGFVLSIIILLLSIFDLLVFKTFYLNFIVSLLFFIVSFIFSYKELLLSNIYFGNRLITTKDIILLFDILFIIYMFVFLKNFFLYERLFYSLFAGFVFYVFVIYILDYTQTPLRLFKNWFVNIYLGLLFVSFLTFIYFKVPVLKNYLTIEKKVVVKVPVYRDKIVYKNNNLLSGNKEKENNSIVYIAPNGKYYEIFETTTGAYFTGYAGKKKYFSSIEEAKKIIDKYNPVRIDTNNIGSKENNKEDIFKNDKLFNVMNAILNDEKINANQVEKIKTNNTNSNSSDDYKLTQVFSSLLEDDKGNKIFTYYKLIPYVIKKFNLSSKNKSDVSFKYISKNDPNYNLFKTAYYYKMIGKNTNLNIRVRCQNLAVIIGLANKWNLPYTRENVFDLFWKEAIKNGYKFDKCCKNKYTYITKEKISCILK